MSLIATYIAIFASAIASVPETESSQYSYFSSDLDSIYVSRWENAVEHSVETNFFTPLSTLGAGAAVGSDNYEPNDNPDDATIISPSNFYTLGEYRTRFSANLNYIGNYGDVDYYAITLLADSHITINVSSNAGVYSFQLIGIDYSGADGGDAVQVRNTIFNDASDEHNKHCSFSLRAGTYYVVLGNDSSCAFDYSFDMSVSVIGRQNDLDIRDARLYKQCGAALWISDIVYENLPHYMYGGGDIRYYAPAMLGLSNWRDYALDAIESLVGDNPFLLSEIIIWDQDILDGFKTAVGIMKDELNAFSESYSKNNKINVSFNDFHVVFDNVLDKLSILMTFMPTSTAIDIGLTVGDLATDTLAAIIPSIFPPTPQSLESYISMLNSLYLYLNLATNVAGGTMLQPFSIPCFASISVDGVLTTSKSLTYSYNKEFLDSNKASPSNVLYSSNIFSISPSESGYAAGKIYCLKKRDDRCILATPNLFESNVQVSNVTTQVAAYVQALPEGYEEWFSFTSHSEDKYSFVLADGNGSSKGDLKLFHNTFMGEELQTDPIAIADYTYNGNKCAVVDLRFGETVYVRVTGLNDNQYSGGTLNVNQGKISPLIHVNHEYSSMYTDISNAKHRAYCSCGASILVAHTFGQSWTSGFKTYRRCTLCNGVYSNGTGIIIPE